MPGRHEPGTGTADLDGWVAALRGLGYQGWIGLEYAPLDSTAAGLGLAGPGRRGRRMVGPAELSTEGRSTCRWTSVRTVAFIGLGIMGRPMAANLVAAGFDVVGLLPPPGIGRRAAGRGWPVGRTAWPPRCGTPTR